MNIKIKVFEKHGIKKKYWISIHDFVRYKEDDQGVSYIVIKRFYGQQMFGDMVRADLGCFEQWDLSDFNN